MSQVMESVNRLRRVASSSLAPLVKTVVVILGNSRSGSSLLKSVLAAHPDIASLDGEIEPLLALTGNGFGYNSDSDALGVLSNRHALADNIFNELSRPAATCLAPALLKKKWENRLLLQFPSLFSQESGHAGLLRALDDALAEIEARAITDEATAQGVLLSKVFCEEPWRINFYDGKHVGGGAPCFDEAQKIEEPPFVLARHYRKPVTEQDLAHTILLFKAPPDVYRIGMYEQIFPNAQVKYLHLSRAYAQSVNGLMDGWLSPVGFFSHDLGRIGLRLDIKAYSDVLPFGRRWWKFDLPPNWRQFTGARLEDVCLNQWMSTHQAIFACGVPALRIAFEDFLLAPGSCMKKISDHLGLRTLALPAALPVTMATEAPRPMRWKKRQQLLLTLGERHEVRAMMDQLGYAMNPATWR
ncbi:hypothetical protein AAKU55_003425 [Oxalobacteraceae bacterium GrIS 1.11]